MEVRYLWVQHEVRSGRILIKKIAGYDNPTDIATKHVDTETMMKCQASSGLRRWSSGARLIMVLTLLPVAAAASADDAEGGIAYGFLLAMAFAVFGISQAGMHLATLVGGLRRAGRATTLPVVLTRTVGIQTELEPPPEQIVLLPPQRFFITQRGDCYHSRMNCRGLATRATELIELAARPLHLRPCSKCHVGDVPVPALV